MEFFLKGSTQEPSLPGLDIPQTDGRWTQSDGKISHGLWQGGLKNEGWTFCNGYKWEKNYQNLLDFGCWPHFV